MEAVTASAMMQSLVYTAVVQWDSCFNLTEKHAKVSSNQIYAQRHKGIFYTKLDFVEFLHPFIIVK